MGADLYIESINNRQKEKYMQLFKEAAQKRNALDPNSPEHAAAQKEVDELYQRMYCVQAGYFRDAYNGAGIARRLGFSWWEHVVPMLDEEGYMQPPKIREFLNRILPVEIKTPTKGELKKDHCKVDDDEHSPESWREYWENDKKELIAFLGMALDRNEAIRCSL